MPLKRSGARVSYCPWRDTFAAAVVLLARRAGLMLAAGVPPSYSAAPRQRRLCLSTRRPPWRARRTTES